MNLRKFLPVVLLLLSLFASGQSYRLIHKAERKLEQREFSQALRLLKRAEKADYGFCGTAYLEAIYAIQELRLQIYLQQDDTAALQKLLDDSEPFTEWSDAYSVHRINLLLRKMDPIALNDLIVKSLRISSNATAIDGSDIFLLDLDDQIKLKLRLSVTKIWDMQKQRNVGFSEAAVAVYKESDYFRMLTDN